MLSNFLRQKVLSRSFSISSYNNQTAPKLPDCDFEPEKYWLVKLIFKVINHFFINLFKNKINKA